MVAIIWAIGSVMKATVHHSLFRIALEPDAHLVADILPDRRSHGPRHAEHVLTVAHRRQGASVRLAVERGPHPHLAARAKRLAHVERDANERAPTATRLDGRVEFVALRIRLVHRSPRAGVW